MVAERRRRDWLEKHFFLEVTPCSLVDRERQRCRGKAEERRVWFGDDEKDGVIALGSRVHGLRRWPTLTVVF